MTGQGGTRTGGSGRPTAGGTDDTLRAESSTAAPSDAEGLLLMRRVAERLFDCEYCPVTVGRFALLRTLGSGGMGVVHLGHDDVLDRRVAIKLIRSERTHSIEARARLLQEARAMARLTHPNVVTVFEAGEYEDGVFVAMEFVEGTTLRRWLADEDRSPAACLDVMLAAARGLSAAHAAGIVHRDFKPENVLLTRAGEPKVGDFGLAGLAPSSPAVSTASASLTTTRTGATLGTPAYMSPEQFGSEPTSPRSDQFSFCIVLYEALFGVRPFAGKTVTALATNVLEGNVRPPPSTSDVPKRVRDAVLRGLSVDPKRRFGSMDALSQALDPAPTRRRAATMLVVPAVAGLAAAGYALRPDAACTGAAEHLRGIWDDARRTAVDDRITELSLPFAVATWDRLQSHIDDYAGRWTDGHTQACRATRVLGEQSEVTLDRRMACLRRAAVELGAAVDVLARADAEMLVRADSVVDALPDVSRCADAEALAADVAPPPADEVEAVQAVRRRLAEAHAESRAGRADAALAAANDAVELAKGLSYAPMQTEVRHATSVALAGLRRIDETVEAWRETLSLALRHDQWMLAHEAARGLAYQLSVRRRDFDEARWMWSVARGMLARVDDPRRATDFHHDLGGALATEGKYDEAIVEYTEALAQAFAAGADGTLVVPSIRANLGGALVNIAAYARGEAELRAAIAETVAIVGEEHLLVARARHHLAKMLNQTGDVEAAIEQARAAVRVGQATVPDHPFVAVYEMALVTMSFRRKSTAEGLEAMLALVAKWEQVLDEDDRFLVAARENAAGMRMDLGQFVEAEQELRGVVASNVRKLGEAHRVTANARGNLATSLTLQGRYAEAEVEYRAALAGYEAAMPAGNPRIASARAQLAGSLSDQNRLDEAEVELRAALRMLEPIVPANSPRIAHARNDLGNILLAQGRLEEAETELRASLSVIAEVRGEDHPYVARTLQTIAMTHAGRKDWPSAVSLLERAEAIARRVDGRPLEQAEVFFYLAIARAQAGGHDGEPIESLAREALALFEEAEGEVAPERIEQVRVFLADPTSLGPLAP